MTNDYYDGYSRTQQMPSQYAQGYQQPYQQQYQRPPQQMHIPTDAVTGTGEWMLTLFLVAIPIVGFIMLLIWSFGSNTAPSKKNWARATLIWTLIAGAISGGLVALAIVFNIPIENYIGS